MTRKTKEGSDEGKTESPSLGLSAAKQALLGRLVDEAVAHVFEKKEVLEKRLEPLAAEAGGKIKEFGTVIEDVAAKSSREARFLVVKALEIVAKKIKPS